MVEDSGVMVDGAAVESLESGASIHLLTRRGRVCACLCCAESTTLSSVCAFDSTECLIDHSACVTRSSVCLMRFGGIREEVNGVRDAIRWMREEVNCVPDAIRWDAGRGRLRA